MDTGGASGTRLNASSISASVSPFCTRNARFLSSDEPRTCAAVSPRVRSRRVRANRPHLTRGLGPQPPAAVLRYSAPLDAPWVWCLAAQGAIVRGSTFCTPQAAQGWVVCACEATPDFAPRSHATIHGPTPPLGRIADRTPAALGNNLLCSDAPPPPRTDFVRQRPMHTTGGGLALWPRWLRETRACRGVLGPCLRVRQEGDGVLQHLLAHRSIGLRRRRLVGVAFVTHGMVITPPKHDGFCHGAFTRAQPAQPCSLHSIRHHAPMPRSIGAVVAWCGEGRGRDSLHLPGCQPAVASRVRPQWGCWPVG